MAAQPVAMHISNGIVGLPVSALFAVLALGVIALCVVKARRDLNDRLVPMAGLVAAFIFAVQMLNFPVLPGVSGHLLGGALAAILVGPWVGALCVALVLVVQCLLFADGGVTALGLNITNMAIIGTFLTYLLIRLLARVLPRTPAGAGILGFVSGLISVVVASQGFVLEYALGGTTALPLLGISATMGGVHLLIGIGEGVITAITVMAVANTRPDLVYVLRKSPKPAAPPAPTSPVQPVASGEERSA